MTPPGPRVVQITARTILPFDELAARIDRAGRSAHPERFAVQLRDPELDARALYELGLELRRRTRATGCLLVVNDRLDLALALAADGVHLGRRSIDVADARRLAPRAWISRSAHDLAELSRAVDEGADAVLFSPVFEAPHKGLAVGLAGLAEARRLLPAGIELLALGGVTAERAAACLEAGADGVASIRADLTPLLG